MAVVDQVTSCEIIDPSTPDTEKRDGHFPVFGTLISNPEFRRWAQLGLIVAIVGFVSGPVTGPQATISALAERGIFASKCPDSAVPCDAQEKAIESGMDLMLSLCNALRVVCGLAQDRLGPHKTGTYCVLLWTVGVFLSGFFPSSGYWWLVMQSIAATAGLGAFGAVGLVHLKEACPTEASYNLWSFLMTALWDVAVLVNLLLAMWFSWRGLPLWTEYWCLSLAVGLPITAGLYKWQQSSAASTPAASAENIELAADKPEVDDPGLKAAMWMIVAAPDFWLYTLMNAMTVTLGYFLLANVGTVVKVMYNATDDEANQARQLSTVLMSVIGLSTILPGKMFGYVGTKRGLLATCVINTVLIVLAALAMAFSGKGAALFAYTLMLMWRVWAFGLCMPYYLWRFGHLTSAIGFGYGLTFTLAGILSLVMGSTASSLLHRRPETMLRPLVFALTALTVVIQTTFYRLIQRRDAAARDSQAAAVELSECVKPV